jgi:N-acetylglucosaminyl-diphospho-decaprenol L-rhamnosyltransferase
MRLALDDLTLSIVSHGHGPLLARLLSDLVAMPGLAQVRLIVTLNLVDEVFDTADFAPLRITVLRNAEPLGFGANHNAAFQHCKTPWFAVMNPDLRLPENPFPALFDAAERWPDIAALAPRVLGPSGEPEDAVRSNLTPASLLARRLIGHREPLAMDEPTGPGKRFFWLAGMFLLLRASAFRSVGGFDARYFMYCEDYDLCARLYSAGHSLAVATRATVVHEAQRDSHRSIKHLRWHLVSLIKVWTSAAFWRITVS